MRRKPAAKPAVAVEFNPLAQHRKEAELEAWICKRLASRDLFAGTTDRPTRRDRLKAVLIDGGYTEAVAGKFQGKTIKWGALFKQLYGEDLA